MQMIVVRHVDGSDPPQFQVVRLRDGKTYGPVVVPSPIGFTVKDRPTSDLMRELLWYLETFLDYPFSPETDHAESVRDALKAWGVQAFEALFGDRDGGRLFDAATSAGYADLQLQISSDEPGVLYWPWEALRDPQAGVLSRTCQVVRRLNKLRNALPISTNLPRDCVHILLVTARPYEGDVRYRSISRPLVDQIERHKLPATVTILRPPTFDQLRAHLRDRPNYYHILHFDGHGSYGHNAPSDLSHAHALRGLQGQLIFEDDRGRPDPQTAEVLSELLRETNVPVVVLNACQSAMVDGDADDAFASVAAGLLRSGVRSVVAMAYSLYVSGAQQFLPAFYRRLFASGNVADAVRAGRQQMLANSKRICARGQYPLDDWLVPVIYEQDPFDLSFAPKSPAKPDSERPILPDDADDKENPYGFIGRDAALLAIERAMRLPPAGILVHGLGGVGKTTLARGFVQWLAATEGLGQGCFWFSFQEIRSAEFVFNEMVGKLFGTNSLAVALDAKIEALVGLFREKQFLIVWDNFEDVCGIPGTAKVPALTAEAQSQLLAFLRKLRGGASTVLITSRSDEAWLDTTVCFKLSIGGLQGEERWEYCDTIVRDLGLTVDRTDAEWKELIDFLDGHPLMMRVVLPKLQKSSPQAIMHSISTNLAAFAAEDPASAKLFATLTFVGDGLPPELRPLLIPLALHEHFVAAECLAAMAQALDAQADRGPIDRLMSALCAAGLLRDRGNAIYEMHPALGRFLQLTFVDRAEEGVRDAWRRAFVNVMGRVADRFASGILHEQRPVVHCFGANFQAALFESERLGMDQPFSELAQMLGSYALNGRDLQAASDLYLRLEGHLRSIGDEPRLAVIYHQLGMIADEQRDFPAAESWYLKSLAIKQKQGDEHGAAITYHQLGVISQKRREFPAAEAWYRKSIAIKEEHSDELGAAGTYHNLGVIAQERHDFNAAKNWYQKSVAIKEKHGDELGAADTRIHLGSVAEELRDFPAADACYRKSLAIIEKQRDEHVAASTYHQLGTFFQDRGDLPAAESWYLKSLAIKEMKGDEYGAASTYHQLGIIAQEQGDLLAADTWYRKSLRIFEKWRDEHGAASTCHQLGKVAREQAIFEEAGKMFIRALHVFRKNDVHNAIISSDGFRIAFRRADEAMRTKLKTMWEDAGFQVLPEFYDPNT